MACAPPTQQAGTQGEAPPSLNQTRTLVIASLGEPASFTAKFVSSSGESGGTGTGLFTEELTARDNRGVKIPRLAAALPELNTDTWRVLPDGKMETIYRLRSGLTWHDGTPLTANDFVFTWRVLNVPDMGGGVLPQRLMEDVVAPDELTLLVKWKGPTTLAGELHGGISGFSAFPRHILEASLSQGDSKAFQAHAYWKTEYVGLGPYRLERWEPGAFLEGRAFDGYVFGRPKIERVHIRFISSQDTMLANFLAGESHYGGDGLGFAQGQVLKREWSRTGVGTVEIQATDVRYVQIQFKDMGLRALQDVRVRRALAHATDKATLADALYPGEGQMADLYMAPGHLYYADADRGSAKYPYDPRRADQLLIEAGLVKGGDGFYKASTGEAFRLDVLSENEKELLVFTDGLRKVGLEAGITVLTPALNRDRQFQTVYPALSIRGNHYEGGVGFYGNFSTDRIASEATNWAGANRGGWSSPEFDQVWSQQLASLDEDVIAKFDVQLARIISEQVPGVPLYQLVSVPAIYVSALRGPDQPIGLDGSRTWNVHQWEWKH